MMTPSLRYRDYQDRLDLVIYGDCSTRAMLCVLARDEVEEHAAWHDGYLYEKNQEDTS